MSSLPYPRPSFTRSARRIAASSLVALVSLHAACSDGDTAGQTAAPTPGSPAPESQAPLSGGPVPGRYGCAESIPRLVAGSYEYDSEGRGFVNLDGRGGYVDPFGVRGSYRYDAASQESRFEGGALDGAVVTPLEGEGPRLWVVIPTESGEHRWSCSLTEEA